MGINSSSFVPSWKTFKADSFKTNYKKFNRILNFEQFKIFTVQHTQYSTVLRCISNIIYTEDVQREEKFRYLKLLFLGKSFIIETKLQSYNFENQTHFILNTYKCLPGCLFNSLLLPMISATIFIARFLTLLKGLEY